MIAVLWRDGGQILRRGCTARNLYHVVDGSVACIAESGKVHLNYSWLENVRFKSRQVRDASLRKGLNQGNLPSLIRSLNSTSIMQPTKCFEQ